jgi:hypothetical protein
MFPNNFLIDPLFFRRLLWKLYGKKYDFDTMTSSWYLEGKCKKYSQISIPLSASLWLSPREKHC